jgi:hypothetical protein
MMGLALLLLLLLNALLCRGTVVDPGSGSGASNIMRGGEQGESSCAATPPSPPARAGAKNIVLFLTDDMDLMLGGLSPMVKTRATLGERGATASHYFIHTPICCPSRAVRQTNTPPYRPKKVRGELTAVRGVTNAPGAPYRPVFPQHQGCQADRPRLHARQRLAQHFSLSVLRRARRRWLVLRSAPPTGWV